MTPERQKRADRADSSTGATVASSASSVSNSLSTTPVVSTSSSNTVSTATTPASSISSSSTPITVNSGTTNVISTIVSYNATWPAGVTTGGIFQGSIEITYTEDSITGTTAVEYTATAPVGGSVLGIIPGQITTTLPILDQSTFAPASATSTSNSTSATKASHTSTSSKSPKSNGLSSGAVAGIAIGTFVIGALLAAAAFFIMWQKRKIKHRRPRNDGGFGSHRARETQNEKSSFRNGTAVETNDFDHDRLFPQPLDDAAVKSEAHNLFSQIDAHVESFYTDAVDEPVNARLQNGTPPALLDPQSRLFMIKKIIAQNMLESMNERCTSDRTFLPFNFTDIARRLQDINLNDHANTLAWSRLRTSFAFLLRQNSATEDTRLGQAISTIVNSLNQQIQPFEIAGSTGQRNKDLTSICKASAAFGQLLLTQPAVWVFEWAEIGVGGNTKASRTTKSQMVYFPALIRLTDNKAKKLPAPFIALASKAIQ